jgi:hypothetical protein
MAESIKNRVGGSHIGAMSDKELLKLLLAVRSDLVSLQTVVNNVGNAVQNIKTNCSNATVNINLLASLNTQA